MAGVLLWKNEKGQIKFLLSRERSNGKWCDFGGRQDQEDGNTIRTAAREGSEESRRILNQDELEKNLASCPSVALKCRSGRMYTMFFYKWTGKKFTASFKTAKKLSRTRRTDKCEKEKTEVRWVLREDILGAIKNSNECLIPTL